jgi:hypothetical protein
VVWALEGVWHEVVVLLAQEVGRVGRLVMVVWAGHRVLQLMLGCHLEQSSVDTLQDLI